jgi:hypothetical protein
LISRGFCKPWFCKAFVFDIVTQHEKIELTKKERNKIKDGITDLLEKLNQSKTVTDWKKQ